MDAQDSISARLMRLEGKIDKIATQVSDNAQKLSAHGEMHKGHRSGIEHIREDVKCMCDTVPKVQLDLAGIKAKVGIVSSGFGIVAGVVAGYIAKL